MCDLFLFMYKYTENTIIITYESQWHTVLDKHIKIKFYHKLYTYKVA